jgi:hypothetical protein
MVSNPSIIDPSDNFVFVGLMRDMLELVRDRGIELPRYMQNEDPKASRVLSRARYASSGMRRSLIMSIFGSVGHSKMRVLDT